MKEPQGVKIGKKGVVLRYLDLLQLCHSCGHFRAVA